MAAIARCDCFADCPGLSLHLMRSWHDAQPPDIAALRSLCSLRSAVVFSLETALDVLCAGQSTVPRLV
jgi:hypothetical protein